MESPIEFDGNQWFNELCNEISPHSNAPIWNSSDPQSPPSKRPRYDHMDPGCPLEVSFEDNSSIQTGLDLNSISSQQITDLSPFETAKVGPLSFLSDHFASGQSKTTPSPYSPMKVCQTNLTECPQGFRLSGPSNLSTGESCCTTEGYESEMRHDEEFYVSTERSSSPSNMFTSSAPHVPTADMSEMTEYNTPPGFYCSRCQRGLLVASDSELVTCVHCGDAVLVKEQYEHECIQTGHSNALCFVCSEIESSPMDIDGFDCISTVSQEASIDTGSSSKTQGKRRRGRKARCEKCSITFTSVREKRDHIAAAHTDNMECTICGAILRSEENLRRHMMCHSADGKHICSGCGAPFKHGRSLRLHMACCLALGGSRQEASRQAKSVPDEKKKFKCEFCPKRFSVRPSVSRHVRIVHHKLRPHSCRFCGRTFTSKYNMQVHLLKNHVNNSPRTLIL